MKNTFALAFLLIICTLAGSAQPLSDIRIVNEDQHSVVLEFTPRIRADRGREQTAAYLHGFNFSKVKRPSILRPADFSRTVLLLLPQRDISPGIR